jgi:tetratricopeptide (TPR) repeat protein
MSTREVCPACGAPLAGGRCAACAGGALSPFIHREIVVLALLIASTVFLFFVTRAAAGATSRLRQRDAAAWYELGLAQLDAQKTEEAVSSLGRAAAMSRDREEYRLASAQALAAAGQEESARQVLLALREMAPESPVVNARLARLEARRHDLTAATRYYQHALHGFWNPDEIAARRDLHFEFIRYLLANDQRSRALAELLLLEVSVPADPATQSALASSFLESGDPARALQHFDRALEQDPASPAALAGAGEAAFSLGEYARALRYLRAAPADHPRVAELLPIVEFVISADPLRPRLTYRERQRRLSRALAHLTTRLTACLGAPSPEGAGSLDALRVEAQALASAVARNVRPRSLNLIEDGMELVVRIERALPRSCAPPGPYDRALLLIGRLHETNRQ